MNALANLPVSHKMESQSHSLRVISTLARHAKVLPGGIALYILSITS